MILLLTLLKPTLPLHKVAFENTLDKWMYCEAFNFEYASTSSLQNQIATTPANFAVIESELLNNNIDEAYINATGTTRKGLAAIEYLLYYPKYTGCTR
jgi:hypothetical protein